MTNIFRIFKKGKWLAIFPFFALLMTANSFGQSYEIGGGIGVLGYSGDLIRGLNPVAFRPAGAMFYRANLSDELALRFQVAGGVIAGNDNNPIDALAGNRARSFSTIVFEVTGSFEYHFMDFKTVSSAHRWSPYLSVGVGLLNLASGGGNGYSSIQPIVPLGVGIKYVLNPRWILGTEIGTRVNFFDQLDGISSGDPFVKDYQYGNQYDRDNYTFIAVTLNYAFYKIQCPFPSLK